MHRIGTLLTDFLMRMVLSHLSLSYFLLINSHGWSPKFLIPSLTKEGDKPAAAGADGLPEWQSVDTSSTLPELARPALELQKDEEEEMIKFHEQIEQEEKELREAASNTLWSLNEEDKDIMVPKGRFLSFLNCYLIVFFAIYLKFRVFVFFLIFSLFLNV